MTHDVQRARRILERKGVYIPKDPPRHTFSWPRIPPRPTQETPPNVISSLLVTVVSFAIMMPMMAWASGQGVSGRQIFASFFVALVMGGAMYTAQMWPYRKRRQAYEAALAQRNQEISQALLQIDQQAQRLAVLQRKILEQRYPSLPLVKQIAFDPHWQKRRLWIRDPDAPDFLVIRVGRGPGAPAFAFEEVPSLDFEDQELERQFRDLVQRWTRVADLPVTLPLARLGSVVVRGPRPILGDIVRRWLVDLAVHHSPRRVHIGVITDREKEGALQWGWMRWLPHTRALEGPERSLLAFTPDDANRLIDTLLERLKSGDHAPAFVLVLDERGFFRRRSEIQRLLREGPQVGIYMILVGDPTVSGVRAELRVQASGSFSLKAAAAANADDGGFEARATTLRVQGKEFEHLSVRDAEAIARALAQWEPPESLAGAQMLPRKVGLADVLSHVYKDIFQEFAIIGEKEEDITEAQDLLQSLTHPEEALTRERILSLWNRFISIYQEDRYNQPLGRTALRRFLHFPIGLTLHRGELGPLYLNVLPEGAKWGGYAAYHSVLIGSTGTGKSEVLKSLIWGAAYLYPPALFNIVFIDFKGGASVEDLKYRRETSDGFVDELLPHIVGLIVNPGQGDPDVNTEAISRRGIYALKLELSRREELITRKGKSSNIWEYNEAVLAARRGERDDISKDLPLLPHLLIILDEFSKALSDFPELQAILDLLARQGRSWGMYLLLANQDRTAYIDRLLDNIGWRISLRLPRDKMKEFIPIERIEHINNVGRGYLYCVPLARANLFQAGYGGFSMQGTTDETWEIYRIAPHGRSKLMYRQHSHTTHVALPADRKQGYYLTQLIWRAVESNKDLFYPDSLRPVYLEPLPPRFSLQKRVYPLLTWNVAFRDGTWIDQETPATLQAPVGLMDNFLDVRYDPLIFQFDRPPGHIWILGVPDSGLEFVIETTLMSLALSYTPAQVWFYILDFGPGTIRHLVHLPHTGAYVHKSEKERLGRLYLLIKSFYEQRKNQPEITWPRIVLVVYGFNHRDLLEDGLDMQWRNLVLQLLREGRQFGLHLLIASYTPTALPQDFASSMDKRLVLDMGQLPLVEVGIQDRTLALTRRARGRGFWLAGSGQAPREAQIAQVDNVDSLMKKMREAWSQPMAPAVETLPECLSASTFALPQTTGPLIAPQFPIGLNHYLEPLWLPLSREVNKWAIFGGPGRGKTTFLLLWAYHALMHTSWPVWYFAARPLPSWAHALFDPTPSERWSPWIESEQWTEGWLALHNALQTTESERLLLLVDDAKDVLPEVPLPKSSYLSASNDSPPNPILDIVQNIKRGRIVWVFASRTQVRIPDYQNPFQGLLNDTLVERVSLTFSRSAFEDIFHGQWRKLPMLHQLTFRERIPGRALFLFRNEITVVQVPFLGSCTQGT